MCLKKLFPKGWNTTIAETPDCIGKAVEDSVEDATDRAMSWLDRLEEMGIRIIVPVISFFKRR